MDNTNNVPGAGEPAGSSRIPGATGSRGQQSAPNGNNLVGTLTKIAESQYAKAIILAERDAKIIAKLKSITKDDEIEKKKEIKYLEERANKLFEQGKQSAQRIQRTADLLNKPD